MHGQLCPLCHKRLATVSITEVDDHAQVHQLRACQHCLDRLDIDLAEEPTPIAEILQRNAQQLNPEQPLAEMQWPSATSAPTAATPETSTAATCSACGLSWADFLLRNRFGCEHDVEAFASHLDEALLQLHGHTRHCGRTPATQPETSDKVQQRQRELLEQQLRRAVRTEQFEQAAILRDQLAQWDDHL